MKVLFITGKLDIDYLEYFTYSGLCQVLGKENVITYPYKKEYSEKSYWDLIKLRPQKFYSREEIKKHLRRNEFDYIFITPHFSIPLIMSLADERLLDEKISVLLDGKDTPRIVRIKNFLAYFKREYQLKENIENIHSLQFSSYIINDDRFKDISDEEKEYDVFFCMSKHHKIRQRVYNILKRMKGVKIYLDAYENRKLPLVEYLKILAKSKIAFSLSGAGDDTLRYWEIPSFKTMMISNSRRNLIENDFINGKEAVIFNNEELIPSHIHSYLKNDKWEDIAKRGCEKLKKYHTNIMRAKYILDIIRRKDE